MAAAAHRGLTALCALPEEEFFGFLYAVGA
jgi:hypothetical protein